MLKQVFKDEYGYRIYQAGSLLTIDTYVKKGEKVPKMCTSTHFYMFGDFLLFIYYSYNSMY